MRRGRIDYRMARRALLRDVVSGLRSRVDVCDAHPDLVRAGRSIGVSGSGDCPICDEGELRQVTYGFFGKGQSRRGGRAIPRDAIANIAKRYGELGVYVVEVCPDCGWHHLLESYWVAQKQRAS